MLRWKSSLKPAAAASSYTLEETFADDSSYDYDWSKGASTTYVGTLVAPASSYTATRLEFNLKKTGTGGNTITAEIWSATGSAGSETPNALLATSTTTVDASGVSTTKGFVAFDFAGQAIASGTKYFFVMKTPSTGDTSNHYNFTVGSSYNTTNFQTVRADATPTWAEANGGRGGYCRSYSGGGGGGSSFPSTSLVGFYKLDEASGVDAADSSGNGYDFSDNGTVASTTGTIGGETVNVRTLDRPAGKYFSLADDANFDVGDGEDFTIAFWAKLSSSMTNFATGGVFSKRNAVGASDAGYSIDLKISNTDVYIRYNGVSDGTTTIGDSNADTGIATDAWAHYMMVLTADATLITYVNNAQYSSVDASSVTGSLANSMPNYIGQRAYNSNGDIIADVTHVGFWKKALDSSERTALYNSGKVLAPAAPSGPAGDAVILNGKSSRTTGGVESTVKTDGSSTVYGGYATGFMYFRDATRDGSWTDDGIGLLWDHSTSATDWVSLIGTTGGTFNVYEEGTSTLIYSLAWSGTGAWSGNQDRYGSSSVDFTGTVPAEGDRVDVYHVKS